MSLVSISASDAIADLARFDTIVDARSESEFAEDRVPGAVNWPSLHDAERAAIGTEYKQTSPFEAKKRGAAMVARNVAAHIEGHVIDKPREWMPLVYCWRGGKRSGALATVLDQIGFESTPRGGTRVYAARRRELGPGGALRVARRLRTAVSARAACSAELTRQGAQVLDLDAPPTIAARCSCSSPASSANPEAFDRASGARPADPALPCSSERKQEDLRPAVTRTLIRPSRSASSGSSFALGACRPAAGGLRFFVADTAAFCAALCLARMPATAVVFQADDARAADRAAWRPLTTH